MSDERRTPGPKTSADDPPILRPGRTCREIARAERFALLIDGEAYYAALRCALIAARRSIQIVAWDIDSRVELVREDPGDGHPTSLGALVAELLERRPQLDVRIQQWDFAVIYAAEREWNPLFGDSPWPRHPRLHVRLDGDHPVGASHHVKLVTVDDALAFVGGMDVSKWRWDSVAHLAEDARRCDPQGEGYPPYHDVQALVDGDAARALAAVARERWTRAGGDEPPAVDGIDHDPWPGAVEPDLRDIDVAIARTEAAYQDRPEVREIERLTLDAIAAARDTIYIENQFFTAATVCESLERRLQGDDSPEVVILLPFQRTSWLEEQSMGVMRSRALRRLRAADRHGRLSVYYPHVPELDEQLLNVHAKLMIVDDRLLKIGSSNLANRSMGLDTECDLAIEAEPGSDTASRIRGLRERLIGHQLGLDDPASLVEAIAEGGGLAAAIDELSRRADGRRLAPLDGTVDEWLELAVPEATFFDPERPLVAERVIEESVEPSSPPLRRFALGGALVAALIALATIWRWTPLAEWARPEQIAGLLRRLPPPPWSQGLIGLVVALACAAGLPLSVLVVAVTMVLDGWQAVLCSWIGAIGGGAISYGIGEALGRQGVRRLAGRRLTRLSRALGEHGLTAVIVLRLVPVAPYAVVNMMMGASHLRWRDFLLGTAIGLLPGVLALTLFVDRVLAALRRGDATGWIVAGVVGVVLLGALALLRHRVRQTDSENADG